MVTYDDWGNEKPEFDKCRCLRIIFWSVLILGAIGGAAYGIYAATHKSHHGKSGSGNYGPVTITTNNYAFPNALGYSLSFLNAQKSGKLPAGYSISWRGNSCLLDGKDVGLDLTGGLYDAGDHVKFGLPLAYTATILSWGILEYATQMDAQKQLGEAVDRVKWITDYLLKCSQNPTTEYYFQVGDPAVDHLCWQRAEDVNQADRASSKVDASNPGADVAGEAAAAMAAASIIFARPGTYQNTTYSSQLLSTAKSLFTFADNNPGLYSQSYPALQEFYNSTGFEDELLWAAAWLYQATGESTYIDYVTGSSASDNAGFNLAPLWLSWDDKRAGVQVLMSRTKLLRPPANGLGASSLTSYQQTANELMCALLPNSPMAKQSPRTPGGLIWVTEFDASLESVNAAFLALVYSDYLTAAKGSLTCGGYTYAPDQLRHFAYTQADYLLGNNPAKTSYLVGYGDTYPEYLSHRGASIPENGVIYSCKGGYQWYSSGSPNPNVAYGGLIGGPAYNDTFLDARANYGEDEAATYNSATLAGLLAGLSYIASPSVPASLLT